MAKEIGVDTTPFSGNLNDNNIIFPIKNNNKPLGQRAQHGVTGSNLVGAGYDIVIVLLDSNGNGWSSSASVDPVLDWTDSRLYQYTLQDAFNNPEYELKLLRAEDILKWVGPTDTSFGPSPAMSFARRLLQSRPVNRNIVLIPAALAGTLVTMGAWAPGGQYYLNTVEAANLAVSNLPNSRVTDIEFFGGTNDAVADVLKAPYKTAFINMIAGFRADIATASEANLIINSMVPEWVEQEALNNTVLQIDEANRELPFDIAKSMYMQAPLGYDNSDVLHYSGPGSRFMGDEGAKKSQRMDALNNGIVTLGIPVNLALVEFSASGGVIISWDVPASDAGGYILEYRDAGSLDPFTQVQYNPNTFTAPGEEVRYNFAVLNEDTEVRVASFYDGNTSAFTGLITIPNNIITNILVTNPDYTNNTLDILWDLNTPAANISAFYRAGGSSDPYTPISLTNLSPSSSTIALDPDLSWDIQLTTPDTTDIYTTGWVGTPQEFTANDFNASTLSGADVVSVPSLGTNTTAWTPDPGEEPTLVTVNGMGALACTPSQSLNGPTFPTDGDYSKLVLVKHNALDFEQCSYLSSANLGGHFFRRDGFTLFAGHANSGTASAPILAIDVWYVIITTYNKATTTQKMYLNGNLIFTDTNAAAITNLGTIMELNDFLSAQNGSDCIYCEAKTWTSELSKAQLDQQEVILRRKWNV